MSNCTWQSNRNSEHKEEWRRHTIIIFINHKNHSLLHSTWKPRWSDSRVQSNRLPFVSAYISFITPLFPHNNTITIMCTQFSIVYCETYNIFFSYDVTSLTSLFKFNKVFFWNLIFKMIRLAFAQLHLWDILESIYTLFITFEKYFNVYTSISIGKEV